MKNKMKNKTILFAFLTICSIGILSAQSQKIEPFTFKERSGESLNAKAKVILTSKTWTSYRQYYINGNKAEGLKGGVFFALKFKNDQQFQASSGMKNVRGTWSTPKNNVLSIATESSEGLDGDLQIEGNYAVYKITEEELVLVTKTGTAGQMIFYCKGSSASPLETTVEVKNESKEAIKAARDLRRRNAVLAELQTEMMLRDIKWKRKYEKRSTSELQSMLSSILVKGKFDKTEFLRNQVKVDLFMRGLESPADFNELSFRQLKKLQKEIKSKTTKDKKETEN